MPKISPYPCCIVCGRNNVALTHQYCMRCYSAQHMSLDWDFLLDDLSCRMVKIIVASVCAVFNLSWCNILERDKTPKVAFARMWLAYTLRQEMDLDFFTLSRILLRQHHTIRYMVEKITVYKTKNPTGYADIYGKILAAFTKYNTIMLESDVRSWYHNPDFGGQDSFYRLPSGTAYVFSATKARA